MIGNLKVKCNQVLKMVLRKVFVTFLVGLVMTALCLPASAIMDSPESDTYVVDGMNKSCHNLQIK